MTSLLLVMSLLFSQLALANYLCPGQAETKAMAEMMTAGQPCSGMDEAQPVLRHHYGANASQSFEMVKVPTPSLPTVVQVLVVPAALDVASVLATAVSAAPEARPPPEVIFLATLRLRV